MVSRGVLCFATPSVWRLSPHWGDLCSRFERECRPAPFPLPRAAAPLHGGLNVFQLCGEMRIPAAIASISPCSLTHFLFSSLFLSTRPRPSGESGGRCGRGDGAATSAVVLSTDLQVTSGEAFICTWARQVKLETGNLISEATGTSALTHTHTHVRNAHPYKLFQFTRGPRG